MCNFLVYICSMSRNFFSKELAWCHAETVGWIRVGMPLKPRFFRVKLLKLLLQHRGSCLHLKICFSEAHIGSHSLHFKVLFVATVIWKQVSFQIFQILRPHRKRGELTWNACCSQSLHSLVTPWGPLQWKRIATHLKYRPLFLHR